MFSTRHHGRNTLSCAAQCKRCASQQIRPPIGRYRSEASASPWPSHVRFSSNSCRGSGHRETTLCARKRHSPLVQPGSRHDSLADELMALLKPCPDEAFGNLVSGQSGRQREEHRLAADKAARRGVSQFGFHLKLPGEALLEPSSRLYWQYSRTSCRKKGSERAIRRNPAPVFRAPGWDPME